MSRGEIDLHILNGDFAQKLLHRSPLAGESLVWRETYLEGPLPECDDLHIFRTARAEFISHFAETAHIGFSALYSDLKKLDETVLDFPEESSLMLWFDSCIFDQTMLMRILWLLNQRRSSLPQVFLYCCDSNCLTESDFNKGNDEKIHLSVSDVESAAQAWELYQRQDAAGMLHLADSGCFRFAPAMKKALIRLADEVPDSHGLTRTHRQILQLVSAGRSSFAEIFKGLDSFEEYPFLGDTACQRHLELLTEKGFLECREQRYGISAGGGKVLSE